MNSGGACGQIAFNRKNAPDEARGIPAIQTNRVKPVQTQMLMKPTLTSGLSDLGALFDATPV